MVQALGFILLLLGAVMWHIAAGNTDATNIQDLWRDFLKTLEGQSV